MADAPSTQVQEPLLLTEVCHELDENAPAMNLQPQTVRSIQKTFADNPLILKHLDRILACNIPEAARGNIYHQSELNRAAPLLMGGVEEAKRELIELVTHDIYRAVKIGSDRSHQKEFTYSFKDFVLQCADPNSLASAFFQEEDQDVIFKLRRSPELRKQLVKLDNVIKIMVDLESELSVLRAAVYPEENSKIR